MSSPHLRRYQAKPRRHVVLAAGLLVLLATLGIPDPTRAQETSGSSSNCPGQYEMCQQQCRDQHAGKPADHIACDTVCSGAYAACDAGVALEKARPWLNEQAKKSKKFLDDLLNDLPSPHDSRKKTKPNSI